MSVYIRGMEMPEDDCEAFRCVIVWNQWVDGEIKMYAHDSYTNEFIGEVINVPPHGRLIDADALEEYLVNDPSYITIFEAIHKLQGMPTIIEADLCNGCATPMSRIPSDDVAPVRHGQWSEEILCDPRGSWRMLAFRCSVCGGFCVGESRFCPNCGAKMDADESEPTIIEAEEE